MVDTIKFSQMNNGGNIANNSSTPGLLAGANVLFNNPWTFYPPGNTSARPGSPIVGVLRFNTDLLEYEYWTGAIWDQLTTNGNNTNQWQNITGLTQALLPGSAYLANNAGQVQFTLPTVCNFGSEIKVGGVYGGRGWKILQNSSQYIVVDDVLTTIGPSGYMASILSTQSVSLVCIVTNIAWAAYGIVGAVTQV